MDSYKSDTIRKCHFKQVSSTRSNNTLEYLGINARKDVQDLNVQKIKLNTKLKTLRKTYLNGETCQVGD